MSGSIVSNSSNVFSCLDLFGRISEFCEPEVICQLRCVSKRFNYTIQNFNIWKMCFEREGLPRIMGADGQPCDNYRSFSIMRKHTSVTGSMISRFFGKIVGQIPFVHEEFVRSLNLPDPFEPGKYR